jgi:hypothetical protein
MEVALSSQEEEIQAEPKRPRLILVTEWNRHHQWPSIAGLRYLIFNSKENGFAKVIKRMGRTCLIDETAFFQWVDEVQVNPLERLGPKKPESKKE